MKKVKIVIVMLGLFICNFVFLYFYYIPTKNEISGCIKTTMFEIELCPTSKNYVPLKKISTNMQKAVIATEDGDFYKHAGFDEDGIRHCFDKLKEKRKIVCGGSTITQQLAKNMFLSRQKSFFRKALEAIITVKIEETLSKKEILERYLNVVQFGKDIYGVKQAAQFYFKKQASDLSIVESSFLAMVLPNPEKYSMSFFKKDLTRFAQKRLKRIVLDLHRSHGISAEQYEASLNEIDTFFKPAKASESLNNIELSKDEIEEFEKELSLDDE